MRSEYEQELRTKVRDLACFVQANAEPSEETNEQLRKIEEIIDGLQA